MSEQKFYGLYRGKVTENNDPEKHGRLRIVIPQLLGSQATNWVWPCDISLVKTSVPSVGQGVWVMFEGGDPSYPIWVGVFGKTLAPHGPLVIKAAPAITGQLVSGNSADGTTGLDLMATLVKMSNEITSLKTRVSSLESRVSALEAALAALA